MRALLFSAFTLITCSWIADATEQQAQRKAAASIESVCDRAIRLANQGEIGAAEGLLREHLKDQALDVEAQLLLGRILDFDGRTDEAFDVWQGGGTGNESDFPLWMAVGEIRQRQGRDGPAVSYRRGSMTVQPSEDKQREEQFKQQHLRFAAEAPQRSNSMSKSPHMDAVRIGSNGQPEVRV